MNILETRSKLLLGKTIFDMDLNVGYYARVSTDKDDQLNSLENQSNYFRKMINENKNWHLVGLFVFIAYAFLGFLDDFMKIKRKQNEGLIDVQKLFGQVVIAVIFFYIYMRSGSEPLLWFHAFNLKVDIGWLYGFFILFMLVATSNAVNITDGLDGLAGRLSFIATLVMETITCATTWLAVYEDIAIFQF